MITVLGCGGGGDVTPDPVNPTTKMLIGVAAAGAPIVGTVNVKGANGATASSLIGIDGFYSIDVEDLTEPYILYAEGSVNGKSIKIYSAAMTDGTINITPVTDFILRNALGDHAEDAYNNWETSQISSADLSDAETDVQTQLAPVLLAAGVSSDVDLLTTAFNADHTGIDLVLDIVDISYSDNTATVTNNLTGSSYTDDITDQNEGGGLPVSDEDTTQEALTDAQAIDAVFQSLEDLYSTAPTNEAITNWFDDSVADEYLSEGENKTEMRDDWITDDEGPEVGMTIWSENVEPFDVSGTAYITGYWIRIHYSDSTESETFLDSMVFDGTNWLWYGDRKYLDPSINSHAFMWVDSNGQTSFKTGFEFGMFDDYNYAYNQGIRSALVTGPGLPETGIVLEHKFPKTCFEIYSTGGSFYSIANDSLLATIPNNAEYTFSFYLESAAQLSTDIETYTAVQIDTDTVMIPPVLNSELNASLFATLSQPTSHYISDLNFGAQTIVNWTKPANTSSSQVGLGWSASSTQYWVDEDPEEGGTSVTLDTTGLPAPDGWVGLFIRVIDEYERHYNMGWDFINNNVPIADAGPNQNVTADSPVSLDGSNSSDADGHQLTYSWAFVSKPNGSNATLSSGTIENPTFTADVVGTYVVSLTVNDGIVDSVPDTVTITVGYAAADLSGVWHYQEIWFDSQLNYVGYTKGSGQLNGQLAVSCVSSHEPDETEDLTFTSSIDANGAVTITKADDPAIKGQMNASKDVIVLVNNEDDDFNFPVLLKQATSYTAADLAGDWYYQEIWFDSQLNFVGYTKGSGQLNGNFAVSCVSSHETDETEDFTFASTIDANGAVTITKVDVPADDPVVTGQMNATKDVIVIVNNVDGDFNFSILLKQATSYSAADLAGDWHYQEIWVGGQIDCAGYTKGSGQLNGNFTFSGVSSDEPDETGDLTFTSSIDANGAVTIAVADEGAVKGQMNASKDVIVIVDNADGGFNFSVLLKAEANAALMTPNDQIMDVAGTWTWVEEQSEIFSGSCDDIGEIGTYTLTITQNEDQLIFSFNVVDAQVSITGTITGNIISAAGTIQLDGGVTIQDTIILTVSGDGQSLTGILSQSSSSPDVCTGTFEISAEKSS